MQRLLYFKNDIELDIQKLEAKYSGHEKAKEWLILGSTNINNKLGLAWISLNHKIESFRRIKDEKIINSKCSMKRCRKPILENNYYPLDYSLKSDYSGRVYPAMCAERRIKHERKKCEKYHDAWLYRIKNNPLEKYCSEINREPEPYEYELSLTTKEQWLKMEEDRYVSEELSYDEGSWSRTTMTDEERENDMFEIHSVLEKYKKYDSSSGMSETQWKSKKMNLERLEKELCTICRLTPKIYDYALSLFKDAAEGRASGI